MSDERELIEDDVLPDVEWEPRKVALSDLKENPDNPKRLTEKGKKRLEKSVSKFGVADALKVNADLTIIDGHSRKKEFKRRGIEEVWVMVPSRLLTDEEYEQMNAVFDVARAGEPAYEMMSEAIVEEWVNEETIIGADGKERKFKKEDALYPLVPKFNEKYDAFIIISDNETDTAFLINKLKMGIEQSYKSKLIGQTHVTTVKKIAECFK